MTTTTRLLSLAGIGLTILGSALLFVYGLPRKKIGNVVLIADIAMQVAPEPGQREVAESDWQQEFDSFSKRAMLLNRMGFAMLTLGSLLQFIAAW